MRAQKQLTWIDQGTQRYDAECKAPVIDGEYHCSKLLDCATARRRNRLHETIWYELCPTLEIAKRRCHEHYNRED